MLERKSSKLENQKLISVNIFAKCLIQHKWAAAQQQHSHAHTYYTRIHLPASAVVCVCACSDCDRLLTARVQAAANA